ncbi:hypothetical protein EDEG_00507 [Edhazardia aedis USNM 41457]|uniref:MIP18 family-like domain-containing protein n=1 Tax=Edhazardia aedis (strain USNM 41457) TaxID=1003232 RepID=J9DFA7_EDHAE|nr:hypothetical protein EDEG_00507 [Edhazardia aedis USNM 41457]|eukprot:EJW01290.1 hypothetical protein EDEG_00507 [Edhazardia aedis USNM 41457]
MDNPNPSIYAPTLKRFTLAFNKDGFLLDITKETIFELIRDIRDPEHPQSLEKLGVISIDDIKIYTTNINDIIVPKNDLSKYCGIDKVDVNCLSMEDKVYCYKESDKPLFKHGKDVKNIQVQFKPTIPHCTMASFIGLSIKLQLIRYLPGEYNIQVIIPDGAHTQNIDMNKQLDDKDRVMAASENSGLKDMLDELLPCFNKN